MASTALLVQPARAEEVDAIDAGVAAAIEALKASGTCSFCCSCVPVGTQARCHTAACAIQAGLSAPCTMLLLLAFNSAFEIGRCPKIQIAQHTHMLHFAINKGKLRDASWSLGLFLASSPLSDAIGCFTSYILLILCKACPTRKVAACRPHAPPSSLPPHPTPQPPDPSLQATGQAVKGGIDLVSAGVKVIKEGYDAASPYIQQGVDVVTPAVKEAVKVTTEVAAPVVSKAVPLVQVRDGWIVRW